MAWLYADPTKSPHVEVEFLSSGRDAEDARQAWRHAPESRLFLDSKGRKVPASLELRYGLGLIIGEGVAEHEALAALADEPTITVDPDDESLKLAFANTAITGFLRRYVAEREGPTDADRAAVRASLDEV